MLRFATALCLFASFAFAHSAEPAGAPPAELDPAIAGILQKEGIRIKDGNKNVMELWFRSTAPSGGTHTAEDNVTLLKVPHGALMGVVRFTERGADRRNQTIKPGVYTLRLSFFPQNGDHQGVAPQRDFLLLSPAAMDKDPNATPAFEPLVDMSRKASGTPHPAVLSVWKVEGEFKPGAVEQEGEHDWVLQTKVGEVPMAVIVAGAAAH